MKGQEVPASTAVYDVHSPEATNTVPFADLNLHDLSQHRELLDFARGNPPTACQQAILQALKTGILLELEMNGAVMDAARITSLMTICQLIDKICPDSVPEQLNGVFHRHSLAFNALIERAAEPMAPAIEGAIKARCQPDLKVVGKPEGELPVFATAADFLKHILENTRDVDDPGTIGRTVEEYYSALHHYGVHPAFRDMVREVRSEGLKVIRKTEQWNRNHPDDFIATRQSLERQIKERLMPSYN